MRIKTWAIQSKHKHFLHDPFCGTGFKIMTFRTKRHADMWLDEQCSLQHFWRQRGAKVVRIVISVQEAL